MFELVVLDVDVLFFGLVMCVMFNYFFDQYCYDLLFGVLVLEGIYYYDIYQMLCNCFFELMLMLIDKFDGILCCGVVVGDFKIDINFWLFFVIVVLFIIGWFINCYLMLVLVGLDIVLEEGMSIWCQYLVDFILVSIVQNQNDYSD